MPSSTTSREREHITITTPELSLAFSLEDGGLRELRRAGGPNLLGYGRGLPPVDVQLNERGWLAGKIFVRYLRHRLTEGDGVVELTITIGIGPLMVDDTYRITGTLLARSVRLCNVGEDAVQLRGVRLLVPWACVGSLESCRFDAPGNRTQPQMPLALAATHRRDGLAPGRPGALQPAEFAFERAPTEGPGVLALHDPASEETLACWYYSAAGTALPQVEGNDRALTLVHQVELAEWLAADASTTVGQQFVLLMHEPWLAALGALRRTWALCGLRLLERPAEWLRDAAIYETHPALAGGFAMLAAELPRLRALGLNTLCLLPIWDFANLKGRQWDGNWEGSGNLYALRDLEQIDPTLGGADDLRALVAAAHAIDMRVLADLPLEGCAADSPLVEQHPEWFCYSDDGQIELVGQQGEVASFNWENAELRTYMLDWALRQLRDYGFDGFRIMPPRAVTPNGQRARPASPNVRMGVLDLLERLRAGIGGVRGDAVLVGALAGPLYEAFHDGALHELAHHMFIQLGLGRLAPVELGTWLEDSARALPRSSAPICFTEYYRTRLINPLADGLRGSRLSRMLLAGMVLCGFVPLIGHGQDHVDGAFIGGLLRARDEHAALRRGRAVYNGLPCSSAQVFAVWRLAEDEQVVGLLNVGPHKHTVTLSMPVDRLGLAEGEYELFELFERQVWEEDGRRTWARDELLALHLTLEPFTAYGLVVRAAQALTALPADTPDADELGQLVMPALAGRGQTPANGHRKTRRQRAVGDA